MLHYCCKVQESSGKQWKITSLQAVKNVRSLMVSEASAENNYAVNRLLRARDLAALLKGRLWDPSKGSSEPSLGTFWEKADDDKTPYSQTGCLHWGEWSCAFQDCLQPGKYRINMIQQIIGWVLLTNWAVAFILLVANHWTTKQTGNECEVSDKERTWPGNFPGIPTWPCACEHCLSCPGHSAVIGFSPPWPRLCLLLVPIMVRASPELCPGCCAWSWGPPAHRELHPVSDSRIRMRTGNFFAAW